jgi:hypothetical protein
MLPIAVEIAPLEGHREEASVLLAACSRAAADAECVLAADAPQGGAAAVAIVTWQSDGQAFVEVGMRRAGQPQWRSRNVTFGAGDETVERWRTVGFVIGTLARSELGGDLNPEPTPTSERASARPSPPSTKERAPNDERTPRRKEDAVETKPAQAAIDVGAEIGPGLASGVRTGGVLRTRWPLQDPLRAVFSLKYLEQNDTRPDGRWFTLGAGLAGVYGSAHAEVSGAAEARVEYFEAKYDPVYGGLAMSSRSRTSVWIAGLGLNATAVWMAMPTLGLYASGDAAWMFGSTRIHFVQRDGDMVRSDEVVADKALRFGAGAGIRLRLW